ncbi:chromosome partition protein Smc [Vulcanimicrobium alpinum]|uniref:Chromosome partition protein Smc n=1 Tax=Vulcanimicrobium alpinum TaxID=3016050 RepID=A0AAN1XZH1_UNVUL|nr:chromosome segregation protein SMC [Vulcanimicrobium alpinum]BDE08209.1 chromosome partition protein Smc [Vulcanimicrobium alpinum]
MRLKSLKVFGFKTFAEATTLEFHDGTTAVVGPNGSGKSNLVDAIRWVLGEQSSRSLRSQKMEDVIFAGNQHRKPLGMAEVSLTFDNHDHQLHLDYNELQITRRAYRAGESEFYINREQVRLRDVHELLMGTGLGPGSYAIVSQGQIDAILSSKPTERRALFEETAGIGKFLARKNEALRRLDATEQNAIRVNDLIAELERRVPELDAQVRRAKRYRKVTARVRDLEILSFLRASATRRDERERVAAELDAHENRRAAAAARAAQLGAQLAALRETLYTLELDLDKHRADAQAARAELSRIEADLAAAVARRDGLERQSSAVVADRERVEAERVTLRQQVVTLDERLAPLTAQTDGSRERELAASAAVADARGALDAVYQELRAVEALAAEQAASEAERRAQIHSARAEIERLEREHSAAIADRDAHAHAAQSARGGFGEREALVEKYEAEVAAQHERARVTRERGEQAAARVAELQRAHRDLTSELAGAESRLHTIEELEAALEGHAHGTRAVVEASQRGHLLGLHGVVSNLISTDEQYARALDVAFGGGLSNIIAETSEDAEAAVAYLRERELGRATFLPLDTLAQREGRELGSLRGRPGVIGYAHTLVRAEPRYRGIVAFLVGRILVVDELRTGIALTRGEGFRDSIVTLEGDQIMGGGAITGGRFRKERSILARRAQAERLREHVPELRARMEQIERDGLAAKAELDAAAAERDEATKLASHAEVALRDVRTQLQGLTVEIERLDAAVAAAAAHRATLGATRDDVLSRLHALERVADDHVDLREQRTALETQLAAARERIAAVEAEQSEVVAAASALREQIAGLSAEREGAVTRLGLLDADAERAGAARETMLHELESLRGQTAALEGMLAASRERVATADRAVETARKERESTADQANQREADERIAQAEDREATAAGESGRRRLAEIDAELGMLQQSFAQNPASEDEQQDVLARYAGEPAEVVEELPRLREELVRLQANVNLNAEADRDELTERERFLREQMADLHQARETLLATIAEIEMSCQVQFNETFDAVKARFSEVFAQLFPGGRAEMWQTNPDNLSETGIEIAVQPPGKKLTNLAALSGGERAMTASALIFALIAVKPSPFYLLDEVDAALDDANVERLSTKIRDVSHTAQMLIVTHNKKTMELAQRMYGVTMQEPGVSSIISATLDERPVTPPSDAILEPAAV